MASKKIRDDLVGVVWVDVDGQAVKLAAGDDIPKGIDVGDHLLAPDSVVDDGEVTLPDGDPDGAWKVDQLKKYADENSVDLGDAKKKDDILAAITLWREANDAGGAGDGTSDPDANAGGDGGSEES